MGPAFRTLFLFSLATFVLLLFQVAEEEATFSSRFACPPGWVSVLGGAGRPAHGPSTTLPAVGVNGAISQRALLLHGSGRDVRIGLQYRAPGGGSWTGVVADTTRTPIRELSVHADGGVNAPEEPTSDGLYRINLPASQEWRTLHLTVHPNTLNLPYLTLYLGGNTPGVEFADVQMAYANGPDEDLLQNADFNEHWPTWARHPEWLTPPLASANSANDFWAPARLVLLLAAVVLCVLWRRDHTGKGSSPWLYVVAWLLVSGLFILGSGVVADLARVLFGERDQHLILEFAVTVSLLIQMVLFSLTGIIGAKLGGIRAGYLSLFVPPMAALMMAATAEIMPQAGHLTLVHRAYSDQFLGGAGQLWLVGGVLFTWAGAMAVCRWVPSLGGPLADHAGKADTIPAGSGRRADERPSAGRAATARNRRR